MKMKWIILVTILLLSFFIRAWQLDKNPAGFFCDEASIGYNAYSIFKTGKDEWGVTFPLFFKAFGEYKNPVFIYSSIPSIALFGLNEFSLRLTSVLYGTLTILVLYLWLRKLFDENTAVWGSFFLAISPWHIHFSRVGFELISSVFWVSLSFYLLYKSFANILIYPFGAISLLISYFTYSPPKIYLPILFLFFFIIYYKKLVVLIKHKFIWFISLLIFLLFVILLLPSIQDNSFWARWVQVRQGELTIDFLRQAYLNHFSFDFLFSKGDIDFSGQFITRHSIRGMGELYWIQLPFIMVSLSLLFNSKMRKGALFFILFLLIYPLGSVFTSIAPQATRSVVGVIPFQVLTALGITAFLSYFKNKLLRKTLMLFLIVTIVLSFSNFINLYKKYPNYSSDYWGWQYGPKEIMAYFLKNSGKYDEMFMSGEFNAGEIFLSFYDPEGTCKNKCKMGQLRDTPELYDPVKRQLFSMGPDYLTNSKFKDNFIIKHTIRYPDGKVAFFIGEVKKGTRLEML
ncbi:hypothetical protein A3F60_03700 [Candidatus Roizmanbacteria bacterium RIFCSPHIGHO2_12_FULL_39_8]|uniref:Glycosyltransferase RgtA/B/C/D-like domain-containing protein n=1 Tax=Candidatus Roizmanbacteria bacterium RIFCSPHIGHO2_12_FULL_39_8 TaxID=1802050 RepID=A0A1F7HW08_9BACT|nr:MAG: hypothetical protein A3F60_03700 [Candidatus Roizmanbacteria bacterium RIFCSPHIGHO2_12_FULL_39_8]